MAHQPSVTRASAPGRVNLIGEHTDYNGGYVLPTAIPQQTHVELTRRADRRVSASSRNAEPSGEFELGSERQGRDWLDYIQGVTWAVQQAGLRIGGFDVRVQSDVPLGGGLSSSAALEVALLRALRSAFDLELNDVQLALLGQRAENDFVGAKVGIMDQMASNLADSRTALFLDTRSLEFERVPLPSDADLVVIHSGVTHGIAGGEYNTRRAQCEAASRELGVEQLRDVSIDALAEVERLPEPLRRRARHVVTEDERVLQAVKAMHTSDLRRLGALFVESHLSLSRDFEVSTPEVDLLVDIARSDPSVYGARITGGGFGGAVVVLAHGGQGLAVGERLTREYAQKSGREPTLLVPESASPRAGA